MYILHINLNMYMDRIIIRCSCSSEATYKSLFWSVSRSLLNYEQRGCGEGWGFGFWFILVPKVFCFQTLGILFILIGWNKLALSKLPIIIIIYHYFVWTSISCPLSYNLNGRLKTQKSFIIIVALLMDISVLVLLHNTNWSIRNISLTFDYYI